MESIVWGEFSKKHKLYIHNAFNNRLNCAEGAIRSGKTIDHCIIASMYLEKCEDKIHLASGSTMPNAKLNIGDCNGFGLEHLFKGRCKWGKYKDNEALYIYTKTGLKIVLFVGGGKADSYKRILGNSYGLWIATEINEHYDNNDSRTSFIKVAFGRQIASKKPFVLWDLNPSNPNAKIYKEYIDKYREQEFIGGYQYQHFTLEDNLNIDEQRKQEIYSMYDINSVWYKRDILGKRVRAEGLIYDEFANNKDNYIIDSLKGFAINKITYGIDFGGNKSYTTFVATAICNGFKDVVIIESERHSSKELTPEKLNEKFRLFIEKCYSIYGYGAKCYCDNEEKVLIRGLRNTAIRNNLQVAVEDCKKIAIKDRIRLICTLISQRRFWVLRHCTTVIDALCEVIWDEKKEDDERLDNGTTDIDTMDAMEYSIERDYKYLMDYRSLK